jgi:hypothetical protein
MSNVNGGKYGFTALFPLQRDANHQALRQVLREMDRHPHGSPLSAVPIIHVARLVIIDHLPFQGEPARLDRLKSSYLLFVCDFDGDDTGQLVDALADRAEEIVTRIWTHCRGFPGVSASRDRAGRARLCDYFKRCQIETNLLLADRSKETLPQILTALMWRRHFTDFVERHQGADPGQLQQEFQAMLQALAARGVPEPGSL